MIFVIELLGLLIRHTVLAVRLLATMFGGHLVLAVILGFIILRRKLMIFAWLGIAVASVFGSAAMTLLELFVGFLGVYLHLFVRIVYRYGSSSTQMRNGCH